MTNVHMWKKIWGRLIKCADKREWEHSLLECPGIKEFQWQDFIIWERDWQEQARYPSTGSASQQRLGRWHSVGRQGRGHSRPWDQGQSQTSNKSSNAKSPNCRGWGGAVLNTCCLSWELALLENWSSMNPEIGLYGLGPGYRRAAWQGIWQSLHILHFFPCVCFSQFRF